MNRAHNARQADNCIVLAQLGGFNNVSVDLIYGTPTLSHKNWRSNIEKVIGYGIPHLSCYALTVETKTALEKMIAQKKIANVETEKQAIQFEMLMQWMSEGGYEHYEISNFSKPGYRSKHNSSYWQAKPYLGLGPSAHSFNGISRQWNIANNPLYIQSLLKEVIPAETEILTADQKFNEYIMIRLRTMEGLSLQKITDEFGELRTQELLKSAQTFIRHKNLKIENGHLQATTKGKLMADGIASDLFII
jgi:oxygen-independent coproporphyrinogen-3 oxidase